MLLKDGVESFSKSRLQGVPWRPVVRTPGFHCRGLGSIPGWGTEKTHKLHSAAKKKKKKKRIYIYISLPIDR